MRVRVVMVVAGLLAGMLTTDAVADDPTDSLASVDSFASIPRLRGAVGGTLHRARQSIDPPALHELPSRR